MNIAIDPSAVEASRRWADDQGLVTLRIYLEGKSCDGFHYGVCVATAEPEDLRQTIGHLTVVVDPETYEFVRGSRLLWINDERGEGFLVENPKHHLYRGKFFKRPSWQASRQKSSPAL